MSIWDVYRNIFPYNSHRVVFLMHRIIILGPKFVLAYKQCDISISRNNSSNSKNTEMDRSRADDSMEGRRSAYEQYQHIQSNAKH